MSNVVDTLAQLVLNDRISRMKVPADVVIVRLTTSMWYDAHGAYQKRSIKYLRRQCVGFNLLKEDCSMTGAAEVLTKIINLDQCKDGVYKFVACDESIDWETGYVDDYHYKLIPIEET